MQPTLQPGIGYTILGSIAIVMLADIRNTGVEIFL